MRRLIGQTTLGDALPEVDQVGRLGRLAQAAADRVANPGPHGTVEQAAAKAARRFTVEQALAEAERWQNGAERGVRSARGAYGRVLAQVIMGEADEAAVVRAEGVLDAAELDLRRASAAVGYLQGAASMRAKAA